MRGASCLGRDDGQLEVKARLVACIMHSFSPDDKAQGLLPPSKTATAQSRKREQAAGRLQRTPSHKGAATSDEIATARGAQAWGKAAGGWRSELELCALTARPSGAVVPGTTRRKGATTVHDTAPTERPTNDSAHVRLNGARPWHAP